MMPKKNLTNNIINIVVVLLILIAIAIRGGATFSWLKPKQEVTYTLADIQRVFNKAAAIKLNPDHSISVFDNDNKELGKALYSFDFNAHFQGYAGDIPLIIYFDKQNKISNIQLLKNNESPEYLEHVVKNGLLKSWDKLAMDTTTLNMNVDAVSGATFSSKAIIQSVQKTIGDYTAVQYQNKDMGWQTLLSMILSVILLILSLGMVLKNWFKKYYWYYLSGVILIFGFWLKQMLSVETIHNWLINGLPWQSNIQIVIVLILAIAMALTGHKNYYCNYLCPMGAIQMLVSKVSPFKKKGLNLKISKVTLRSVYLTFIWSSLILGFSLPLSSMEPFKAYSFTIASNVMIIAGLIIVILSLFFNRPWCQICPTGCLLNTIPSLKSKKINHAK